MTFVLLNNYLKFCMCMWNTWRVINSLLMSDASQFTSFPFTVSYFSSIFVETNQSCYVLLNPQVIQFGTILDLCSIVVIEASINLSVGHVQTVS